MPNLIFAEPDGSQTIQGPLALTHLVLRGTTAGAIGLETHNTFAVAGDFFTHADAGFRAPYINFYKSRGTEANPTPVTFTGYELDSIGGINFGGYTGAGYAVGAAIYTQTDENWSPSGQGAHLSIYDTHIGAVVQRQVIQFGGVGPNGEANTNIIAYRGISFGGAQAANPTLNYTSGPATLRVQKADGSADAALVTGQLTVSTPAVPASASAAGVAGTIAWDSNFVYVCVATNTWKRSALSTW